MKLRSWLLTFCLLVTFAAQPSTAREATGTLLGTVTDASGNTLSGATVEIQTSDGLHPHATHTDAKGHFQFAHFAIGQYDLRAYYQGAYSNWAKRITVRSRKPTSIDLRLSAAKP